MAEQSQRQDRLPEDVDSMYVIQPGMSFAVGGREGDPTPEQMRGMIDRVFAEAGRIALQATPEAS